MASIAGSIGLFKNWFRVNSKGFKKDVWGHIKGDLPN